MHDVLVFLTRWSPHIWLFGSLFGVAMSGTLFKRSYDQRRLWLHVAGKDRTVVKFWYRHAVWFFLMHLGFSAVGVLAVAEVKEDWADLLTLFVLMSIPVVLVYRSYDALRLNTSTQAKDVVDNE